MSVGVTKHWNILLKPLDTTLVFQSAVELNVKSILPLIPTDKEVTDGCRLQTAKYKVEAIVTRLERFQLNSVPPARPQATAKRNPEVAPTLPRVRQTTTRGSRPGMFLPRAKVSGEGKFFHTHPE